MKLALYVDGQNLWNAAKSFGRDQGLDFAKPDYETILVECIKIAKEWAKKNNVSVDVEIVRQSLYSVSRERALGFENALSRFGYTVHNHILRSETDNWDWDTQIAVDVVHDIRELKPDLVIVASGDGDLAPVLTAVNGSCASIAVGFPGSTSDRFQEVCLLGKNALYT